MILIDEVSKAIAKPIKDLGYSDFKVSLKREKGTLTLEVLVDKDDAISLDDIITVNDTISPILDGLDLINEPYMLDVSSFGAEKPIDVSNLEKYVGKYINIHLSNPYKGENILEGDLVDASKDEITLTYRIKTRVIKSIIKRSDIDRARLAIKF
jgi:ribosome maturation factor RimP